MCGIAGRVDSSQAVTPDLIGRMCAALEHRGPDSKGSFLEPGVGLGIRRLRVIDLDTGDQPISNEEGSVVVVHNGEIYNYRELRSDLEARGHTFKTQSDTEVIVHLYEVHGAGCVRSLHGMFAFALWDRRHRRLLLARDRVGKKPLVYSHENGSISFASELHALLQDPAVSREVDYPALDDYLFFQYVPAPRTAFRHIRKLPPASTLVFEDGRVTIERYWQLDYGAKRDLTLAEAGPAIREALGAAVRRRLVSDVPLGALLSGGIDSSAVVAAMSEASSDPVKTFSIGFAEDSHDELPYARQIAERFGTDHHEFVVRPNAIEVLPMLIRHYGEPYADSSAIPSFYVAHLARPHVTVVLNGDGGDESFAGYARYPRFLRLLTLSSRTGVKGAAAVAASAMGSLPSRGLRRLQRAARLLSLDPPALYARHICPFDEDQRREFYSADFAAAVRDNTPEESVRDLWERASGESPIDRLLEIDVETYLPGDLLVKIDIATMAHSLEARSPFLDHELMELAASLPADVKLNGAEKKVALRSALRGWLPDEILDRPKKGFGVPIDSWLRSELSDWARSILLDPASLGRGLFRERSVVRLLDSHERGVDHSPRIWALLCLELWFRELVDSPPTTQAGMLSYV